MEPFLKQIARQFIENDKDELKDYCFVFPNRRSGLFFKEYINELSSSTLIMPEITTISNFITDISGLVEASRIELLFLLYNEYQSLAQSGDGEVATFDQFIFWGDMIINDFNDVDKYLADPKRVFTNIKEIKEINSTYLTEEQLQVLNDFFDVPFSAKTNIDAFWTHTQGSESVSDNKNSFIKLWQILYPLYISFTDTLRKQGKSYSGIIYREAVNYLKNHQSDSLYFKKYIFIGFNILSTSEYKIFSLLQDMKVADFYWDFNSSILNDGYNKGGKFIRKYKKIFKSRYKIDIEGERKPNIHVISVPSNIGQVKYSATIIEDLIKENKITNLDNALNTAIVLPDEELFVPVLSSIPEKIGTVNITLGYPIKYTSIAILISSLSLLHSRARLEKGEWTYFHEDIKNVLTHPYIKGIAAVKTTDFLIDIQKRNLFYVNADDIRALDTTLSVLFNPVENLNNRSEVIAYFRAVIEIVENALIGKENSKIELGFIAEYRASLSQLIGTISDYEIELHGKTFFFLVERMLNSTNITFEGEPLKGLQVMGVLETRCLDFDNIIILSMNEKIFPKKHFTKTFIPNNLRKGFGLATIDYQECIYSYYFYRLLSRSSNAYLLYDSRTQGISSGEPSRYIYQLKFLYNHNNISYKAGSYDITSPDEITFNIVKNPAIMNKLNQYRTKDSGRYLSASAINSYIDCPLKFYFQKIEEIRTEDEMTDFIDSATFGTIVHDVLHDIYSTIKSEGNGRSIIDSNLISAIRKTTRIDNFITYRVNLYYLKRKEEKCNETLHGEAILIADIIKYYIDAILDYDSKTAFEFVQGEHKESGYWQIDDNTAINFKQYIDRVDCIETPQSELLRIIDYKTGSDEISVPSVADLFNVQKGFKRGKGILQLFIYCNFYANVNNYKYAIKPIIYQIKQIKGGNEFNIRIARNEVNDYNEFNTEFLEYFTQTIKDIFDENIPFSQAKNADICKYCDFNNICQR